MCKLLHHGQAPGRRCKVFSSVLHKTATSDNNKKSSSACLYDLAQIHGELFHVPVKHLTQESRNSDHQRASQEDSSHRAGRGAPGRTSEDVSGPSGVRRSSKQLRAAREGPQSTTERHDCEASQQETSAEVCGDTVKHRPDTSPERDMRASSQWCEGQALRPFVQTFMDQLVSM